MEVELKKTNHLIERFEAVDGDTLNSLDSFYGSIKGSEKKQYATYLSHLKLLKKSLNLNSNYIIVLEDDVTLCDDFDQRLDLFIESMPNDWVIGYLGYNEQDNTEKTMLNEHIAKIKNVFGCFGLVIKKEFIPKLINIAESKKIAIDELIKERIQNTYSCYAFLPFLLYVNDDYSDIWLKDRSLARIKKYFSPSIDYVKEPEIKKPDLTNILNKQPRKIVENKVIKKEGKRLSPDISKLLSNNNNQLVNMVKKENFYSDINPIKTQMDQNRQALINQKKDEKTNSSFFRKQNGGKFSR